MAKLVKIKNYDLKKSFVGMSSSKEKFINNKKDKLRLWLRFNEKEIDGLYRALEFYPHLRYLNIKDNKIRDISMVANLHYLVYLEASSNDIKDVSFLENPHI